jgi:hypothetical protein
MKKTIGIFLLVALLNGCASNYYMRETKELNESEKQQRMQELELVVKKMKPGTPVRILLYNGEVNEGAYYSYLDGFVSLRIDDTFRDTELSDIRGMEVRSSERMKTIMEILIIAVMVGIIVEFAITH